MPASHDFTARPDDAHDRPRDSRPERIGPYRILELLGSGGMGAVYLAEQREPVQRRVAIKLIRDDMVGRSFRLRFEAERQALARMDHPCIAKIYDTGVADGRPYFAMEYINGEPLTQYCVNRRLGVEDRLQLFVRVCRAVQHAHNKGVAHRDIKPVNILVQETDGQPVPKIIDFGIAKALDRPLVHETLFTEVGQLIGTPGYMSPEQLGVRRDDVDHRTDVYSLGVVLYELLVGQPPFPDAELLRAGVLEMQRIIGEVDPPRPSTKVPLQHDDVSATRVQREIWRSLRSELDWATLRALEKDPGRRYQTPAALAEDIERFLRNEPIVARPPSATYRIRKFVARYRVHVAWMAALALLLVVGTAVALSGWSLASQRLSEYRLISYREHLDRLLREREQLFPLRRDKVPALRAWVDTARDLRTALPEVRSAIDSLGRTSADGKQSFVDQASAFLRESLVRLESDVEALVAESGDLGKMQSRLAWAQSVQARTVDAHRAIWERATLAIRNSDGETAHRGYGGFRLEPIVGLIPLGMNPKTKLWEFSHPRSGAPDAPLPGRRGGKLSIDERTGIVFVLVPGSENAWLGSQSKDPSGRNYTKEPVHNAALRRVAIRPFLISKYETNRAQWERITEGDRPSSYKNFVDTCPVEYVTAARMVAIGRRYGFSLPTGDQWEWAARAGTTTPWWTGSDRNQVLIDNVNLADQSARRKHPPIGWPIDDWPELDDGFPQLCPVNTFLPNPWGLFQVHGNIAERCVAGPNKYEERGGSYPDTSGNARCAVAKTDLGDAVWYVGVRFVINL